MKILTTKNSFKILVDDEVYKWACKIDWKVTADGYVAYRKGTGRVFLHRLICKTPNGYFTDHINGDKLDNTFSNLRIVTNKQNSWNSGVRSDNSSGYRGVSFKKERKKWRADIKANGINYYLGCYDSIEEAVLKYNKKAKELYGEFARLNKI